MIPRKKLPSPRYNIHDVSRGSISTDEFLYRWTRNDFFSLKFVERSKYCLEIFKTWEKLSCSHILYFVFFFKIVERTYGNRIRGDLLTASEYWEFFLFY